MSWERAFAEAVERHVARHGPLETPKVEKKTSQLTKLWTRTRNALLPEGIVTERDLRAAWEKLGRRGFMGMPGISKKGVDMMVEAYDLDGLTEREELLARLENERSTDEQSEGACKLVMPKYPCSWSCPCAMRDHLIEALRELTK